VAILFCVGSRRDKQAARQKRVGILMPEAIRSADDYGLLNWGGAIGVWFCLMIFTGGVSNPSSLASTFHALISSALLLTACWRLRSGFPSGFSMYGWALMTLGFVLIGAHLVPLPPSMWEQLAGRDLFAETLKLTGSDLPWLPLTLTPAKTSATLIAYIPLLAGMLAVLSLKGRDMFALASFVVVCAVVGVVLGLLQKTGRVPDWLYLHGKPDVNAATGSFGNRNFLAAQIFVSLPFLAILATAIQRRSGVSPWVIVVFVLVYMAIMLSGLASVGSRGGVLLAMPSVLLTLLFVYRPPANLGRFGKSGFASVGVIGGILVMSQASMIGILRLVEKDPLADFRSTIFATTWSATKAFWPAGSGFGSFVPVYQMFETPGAIVDRYVNAAHNDWLQLLLEGGLPATILGLGLIIVFFIALWRTLKNNMVADDFSSAVRAGLVVVALLAGHAILDFGLRTPALLSLLSLGFGLTCLAGRYNQSAWQSGLGVAKQNRPAEPMRKEPTPRTKPYFKQPPQL
jgi:O-antigen ligase